ncbi:pseudouridine synthase [Marilutibacter alkalisoli]|uniref:Dual-specificity RNA pseudouridine synthase RluA n=1 Tax=Marilutibacter alkalisoli TaxID=2591633 RepID=A0A514BQ38_9GAMM|nr:pseudouridine synthase [Lysobacter alkalisoli]QDH69508.1 RNA pseudouridine synthase [Lysobacter alkalisoli]
MAEAIDIHYCDEHLLVAGKPAGLLSVPGRLPENRDCVISRLQVSYPDVLTVHRLDQVTSGLMVFARGKMLQSALSSMFERRQIDKRYEALVEGLVEGEAGEVELPLICDWPNRPRQKVGFEAGKHALTRWRVLQHDTGSGRTRLELEPVTGRSHQLRVHLASIGHPIVGDSFYGAAEAPRVCLHASRLSFMHPVEGVRLEFASAAPF